jgi:hypothetical protein
MPIEFHTFDDELVAYFLPEEKDDHVVSFDIIQRPEIACSQFELSEWIGRRL